MSTKVQHAKLSVVSRQAAPVTLLHDMLVLLASFQDICALPSTVHFVLRTFLVLVLGWYVGANSHACMQPIAGFRVLAMLHIISLYRHATSVLYCYMPRFA